MTAVRLPVQITVGGTSTAAGTCPIPLADGPGGPRFDRPGAHLAGFLRAVADAFEATDHQGDEQDDEGVPDAAADP